MIRVLLVDDHSETRQQITPELKAGNLIDIIGEAQTSDEALRMAERLLPDIVLLDLHLPGLLTPPSLIQKLSSLRNVKVIAFADNNKAVEVQELLEAGACGYILKSDTSVFIRMAVIMVARGSKNIISSTLPREINHLTSQERTILKYVNRIAKLEKAAQDLGISEDQLTEALSHLAAKLDLGSILDLKKWSKKNGF
jgi:DNA-binding NarL/FixJ family response regulator